MASVRRDLPMLEPPPVSAGRPALAATKVRVATVAARYSWNFVLERPKLDFMHFKQHKRGNLQYDGTEWRGVSVHRSWRSIVKNPPTPTTSGFAQR